MIKTSSDFDIIITFLLIKNSNKYEIIYIYKNILHFSKKNLLI